MENIEHELVDALQPIRGMALAVCINHFFEMGIYDHLDRQKMNLNDLSTALGLEKRRLDGFLHYLKNEDILDKQGGVFSLTNRARSLHKFKAWYTMLVGGYAQTYMQVAECMDGTGKWATRDVGKVGIGSCGISHYDAIPLTRRLMEKTARPAKTLLDLGCGNALYLVEFCKQVPGLSAYGVEPSENACRHAETIIVKEGLQDRIKILNKDINSFLESDLDCKPDLLVLGFILQEILGQEGEEGVVRFLTTVSERYPEMNLIVIEVDNQIDNPTIMGHRLAKSYYNPYYLIHYFTPQRLETDQWWQNLFTKCGLEIVASDYPDNGVDSTRLELGYLLRPRS